MASLPSPDAPSNIRFLADERAEYQPQPRPHMTVIEDDVLDAIGSTLGASAGWVYVLLERRANGAGTCHPSQETLAEYSGLSVRQVRRIISALEGARFITRRKRYRHGAQISDEYALPYHKTANVQGGHTTGHGGGHTPGHTVRQSSSEVEQSSTKVVPPPPPPSNGVVRRGDDSYIKLLGPQRIDDLAADLKALHRDFGGAGWVKQTLRELSAEVPDLSQEQLWEGLVLGVDRIETQLLKDNGHIRNPPGLARWTFKRALEEQL